MRPSGELAEGRQGRTGHEARTADVVGEHGNQGRVAVLYGPLVLAADASQSGGLDIDAIGLASQSGGAAVTAEPAPEALKTWPGARSSASMRSIARRPPPHKSGWFPSPTPGATGAAYRVWLPLVAEEAGKVSRKRRTSL